MPLTYRYNLDKVGTLPIKVKEAKDYLKIDGEVDTKLLQDMIATVVQFAERYTGRDLRENTWKLVIDCFKDRTLLRKSEIASVISVKYTLLGTLTTIATSVWYLKQGHQFSEILLKDGQVWPTDLDEIEAGIEIIFLTQIPRNITQMKVGILEHLAFLYQNRGDCDEDEAARKSGATEKYDQGRIQRI